MNLIKKLKMKLFMKALENEEFKTVAMKELLNDKKVIDELRVGEDVYLGGEIIEIPKDTVLYKCVLANSHIKMGKTTCLGDVMFNQNMIHEDITE